MKTTLKVSLGALAVLALAGAGFASAHGYGIGGPGKARGAAIAQPCDLNITVGECRALLGDPCNDAMTVGDCQAAWEAKREQEKAERQAACVEETGNETLCQELAQRPPPPPGGPRGHHGPEGRGFRGPPPSSDESEPQ